MDKGQCSKPSFGYWVWVVGLVCACGTHNPKAGQLGDVVWQDSLVVAVQELKGSPEDRSQHPVLLYNNQLICMTYPSEPFIFNVLSVDGDSVRRVGNLIRRGRGPMEAVGAQPIVDQSSGMLYMGADMGMASFAKLFAIDINKPIDPQNIQTLSYPAKNGTYKFAPITPGRFLTIDYSESGNPFGSCSSGDSVVQRVDFNWPSLGGIDGFLKTVAFEGDLSKQWGTNRYVYSSRYGNYVLLFDLEGSKIQNVHTLFGLLPKAELLADGMNLKQSKPHGLVVCTTGKYLYVKYLEHPNSLDKPWRENNELFIFDWNGTPVRKIILNADISGFVVSQDDKLIYGLGVDPQSGEKVLVRAKISD